VPVEEVEELMIDQFRGAIQDRLRGGVLVARDPMPVRLDSMHGR
jgi:hypothetical protein